MRGRIENSQRPPALSSILAPSNLSQREIGWRGPRCPLRRARRPAHGTERCVASPGTAGDLLRDSLPTSRPKTACAWAGTTSAKWCPVVERRSSRRSFPAGMSRRGADRKASEVLVWGPLHRREPSHALQPVGPISTPHFIPGPERRADCCLCPRSCGPCCGRSPAVAGVCACVSMFTVFRPPMSAGIHPASSANVRGRAGSSFL